VQKGEQDPVSARTLSVIQPNFRYAYREYFDDYTHVAIFTHVSLCDVFRASGFDIVDVKPRFLPLSIKSGFACARKSHSRLSRLADQANGLLAQFLD
jgi:hypothetical protein